MKKFAVLLTMVFCLSVNAFAMNRSQLFHCSFNLNDHTKIFKDLALSVNVDSDDLGQYSATLTVTCDICKAMPRYFNLNGKVAKLEASFDGDLEGTAVKLEIPLESFAPTVNHPSSLFYSTINDGKAITGVCTDLRQ
jgi:hypothetical protein